MSDLIRNISNWTKCWWSGLSEVWQSGYSREYRVFRLREAFNLLPDRMTRKESMVNEIMEL